MSQWKKRLAIVPGASHSFLFSLLFVQIKELRSVRQQFQELEHIYLQHKSNYDNVAVGLESERLKLEEECDAAQNDCVREESRFHYYHAMVAIADVRKQKAKDEKEYTEGPNRYLPDFKTYCEVYEHKIKIQKTKVRALLVVENVCFYFCVLINVPDVFPEQTIARATQ